MDRPLCCWAVRFSRVALVLFASLGLTGCGSSTAAPTAAVSGKVTDASGAPVKEAMVSLSAAGKGYGPSGRTGDDGSYQLSTFEENDGAPPGDYTVTVTDADGKTLNVSGGNAVTVKNGANTLDIKVE